jgi:quinoprotein glucose dehydrogenase
MRKPLVASILFVAGPAAAMLLGPAVTLLGQGPPKNTEWRYYGGDERSTRYAPLEQIDKQSVKDFHIVWRWKSDNLGPRADFNWEATPLMIGGVLYTTAGSRRDVVAIDGATGETLWIWRYDEGRRGQLGPRQNSRGLAFWSDGRGDDRVIYITPGYHLVALSAHTGLPVSGFGKGGLVDLYEGLDRATPKDGTIGASSPPLIVNDIAVIGAALQGSAPTKENIAGFVRGYDVRTGRRVWIFHTIPVPGEPGNETWEHDSWSYTGNTGVWGPMSADAELGYVYLPVETPTNDYYGGHRLGDNLFAETLVCLDAKSGRRVWHFQFVHHGIWDYDIPTAPILIDVTVRGQRIKAVAQVTKQAFTYVFDRTNGRPVWPIEERPVPQTDVPGEKTSPTQPFPTRPAPFDRQGITTDDLIDFTPQLKAEATKIAAQYRTGPLFTPPSLSDPDGTKGTLQLPSGFGGANWTGGAADPETGVLYVPSITAPRVLGLVHDPNRSNADYVVGGGGESPGGKDIGPQGLPLVKPPWGRITAIDLNTGEHVWMVANGETPAFVRDHPALKGVNLPRTGQGGRTGILVTKTLMFAGDGSGLFSTPPGAGGPMFRAYDKRTGDVVGEFRLPASQTGIPMTYMLNERQYIVLAVGDRGVPAELVALAVR